ncbi:hypothetical protein [Arenibacter sp. S6351L]|uniref:hypothetical protein n=1 Tax=Arenibacter sp. S6351L TaxID=2926407 RepID=UPI001FF5C723|nr:hypothetical protein [Arenibacter sp. S6351L]MBU2905552.1 hypothetical protein [Arenibacter algicola]MCK0133639.1 hypothetical protein [Arenibacter sp. S6351L]
MFFLLFDYGIKVIDGNKCCYDKQQVMLRWMKVFSWIMYCIPFKGKVIQQPLQAKHSLSIHMQYLPLGLLSRRRMQSLQLN